MYHITVRIRIGQSTICTLRVSYGKGATLDRNINVVVVGILINRNRVFQLTRIQKFISIRHRHITVNSSCCCAAYFEVRAQRKRIKAFNGVSIIIHKPGPNFSVLALPNSIQHHIMPRHCKFIATNISSLCSLSIFRPTKEGITRPARDLGANYNRVTFVMLPAQGESTTRIHVCSIRLIRHIVLSLIQQNTIHVVSILILDNIPQDILCCRVIRGIHILDLLISRRFIQMFRNANGIIEIETAVLDGTSNPNSRRIIRRLISHRFGRDRTIQTDIEFCRLLTGAPNSIERNRIVSGRNRIDLSFLIARRFIMRATGCSCLPIRRPAQECMTIIGQSAAAGHGNRSPCFRNDIFRDLSSAAIGIKTDNDLLSFNCNLIFEGFGFIDERPPLPDLIGVCQRNGCNAFLLTIYGHCLTIGVSQRNNTVAACHSPIMIAKRIARFSINVKASADSNRLRFTDSQRSNLVIAISVHRRHDKGAEGADREGGVAGGRVEHAVFALTIGDVQRVDQFAVFRLQRHTGQSHGGAHAFGQGIRIAFGIHQADVVSLNAHNIHADGFHQGIHVIIADSIAHGVHLNGNTFRQNSGNGSLGIAGFGSQGLFRSFGSGRLIVDHHGVGINLLIFNTFGQGNSSRALGQHQFGGLIGTQRVALDFGGFNLNDFTDGSFTGDFLANGFFGSLVKILHRIAHHHRFRGGSRSGLRSRSRSGLRSRSRSGLRGGSRSGLRSGSHSRLLSGSHSGLLSGSHSGLLSGSHNRLLSGSHSGLLNGSLRRLLNGSLRRLLGGNLSRLLLNRHRFAFSTGLLSRLTGRRRCRREFIVGEGLDRSQGSQHRKDQQYADHAACLEP